MKRILLVLLMLLVSFPVYAADTKISEMTEATSVAKDDILPVVVSPGGSPANRKLEVRNFMVAPTVGSGAITITGQVNYVVCTSTCNMTPVTPVAGSRLCVRNAPGSATVITLNAITDVSYEKFDKSAWNTANKTLTSGGTVSDSICIYGYDATHYLIVGVDGTWTDGT